MSEDCRDDERGRYLCETCWEAFTDCLTVQDGLEQACCTACGGGPAPLPPAQAVESSQGFWARALVQDCWGG